MICRTCDENLESGWNFCPTCGVNQAPLKKLVRAQTGESEESKKRRQLPSMREMVLDVVARQAISGANWKVLCREVMEMHEISVGEVRKEVYNRGYKIEEDGSLVKFAEAGNVVGNLKNVEETNLLVFPTATSAGAQNYKQSKLRNRVEEIFKRNFEANDDNNFDDLFERKNSSIRKADQEQALETQANLETQARLDAEIINEFRRALKATLSDLNKLLEELG